MITANDSMTAAFEAAAAAKGYKLIHIFYKDGKVSKALGSVITPVRIRTEDGHKYVNGARRVRWNADGRCYSLTHNFRIPCFDLHIHDYETV